MEKKAWEEFRNTGLLWWINMILNTFGWTIVVETENGKIVGGYPARTKLRGFSEGDNAVGYIKVSEWMEKMGEELRKESNS